MSKTPQAPTFLEPVRDIPAILARIDALFACLQETDEERQQLYVVKEVRKYQDLANEQYQKDRSAKKDAIA